MTFVINLTLSGRMDKHSGAPLNVGLVKRELDLIKITLKLNDSLNVIKKDVIF